MRIRRVRNGLASRMISGVVAVAMTVSLAGIGGSVAYAATEEDTPAVNSETNDTLNSQDVSGNGSEDSSGSSALNNEQQGQREEGTGVSGNNNVNSNSGDGDNTDGGAENTVHNLDADADKQQAHPEDNSDASTPEASWSAVIAFADGMKAYANALNKRVNAMCGADCKVNELKDSGLVTVSSGYSGTYVADAADGLLTRGSDQSVMTATTYRFTLQPGHVGKFSVRNADTVNGTRPTIVISAHGPMGGSGTKDDDYTYAGVLGSQKGGLSFSGAQGFSTWLNKTYKGNTVNGDYLFGNRTINLCGTGLCVGKKEAESNWLYFNNKNKSPITINVVLAARDNANHRSVRLKVRYTDLKKGNAKPVYRLYWVRMGLHHYTANPKERAKLLRGKGWRDEGVAFQGAKSGAPVYRLFNVHNGLHHWTKSAGERDALVRGRNWRYEGVAFYAPEDGVQSVYRIYNPRNGEHLYTTSYGEYKHLGAVTWREEGVAWFGGVA